MSTLLKLSQSDRFGTVGEIALNLAEVKKQDANQAILSIIKVLTRSIKEEQKELEKIKLLQTLIIQMIQNVSLMLQSDDQKTEGKLGSGRRLPPPIPPIQA